MWGHSTGGEIALRVITARDTVDATVLFGSMGADAAGVPGEYYTYPGQRHVFRGDAWEQAMERTLAFFDRYVKHQ